MSTTEYVKETRERISQRFEVLELLTDGCISGAVRSLIVSGPPGLGKSYTVEQKLRQHDPSGETYTINKGYSTPVGLYRLLYKHRHKGHVVVMDDTDSIFFNETSLNLLKTVCDSTKERVVSWRTNANLFTEDGSEVLPKEFVFEGANIGLTNEDFDHGIAQGHKFSKHYEAMISRSHYINLAMKNRTDYLIRIFQVIETGQMLTDLTPQERDEVKSYIIKNYLKLRELSLRMVVKLGDLRKTRSSSWERIANVTCCK